MACFGSPKKSGRARKGAQSSTTHSAWYILSLPWSRATFIWFLLPVKGIIQSISGKASFSVWLILVPRLTCSTFILCLPLSFISSGSPESLYVLSTPHPSGSLPSPAVLLPPGPRLSHHPQIPTATFAGLWFKKGMSSWNTPLIYVENRKKKYT